MYLYSSSDHYPQACPCNLPTLALGGNQYGPECLLAIAVPLANQVLGLAVRRPQQVEVRGVPLLGSVDAAFGLLDVGLREGQVEYDAVARLLHAVRAGAAGAALAHYSKRCAEQYGTAANLSR